MASFSARPVAPGEHIGRFLDPVAQTGKWYYNGLIA